MKETNQHFYASSCAMWATTNDERDLPALLDMMEKDGYTFNLFSVPGSHNAEYDIKMYQPQVEGAEYLGTFTLPKKGRK
jgi:membrane-anchored protein YejM (alkaline phosphatase superfamily)